MAPTIKAGEKVRIEYIAYAIGRPQRWDIIAFNPPVDSNSVFIARVIALPGESVSFTNQFVEVNGVAVTPPEGLTNVAYYGMDHEEMRKTPGSTMTSPYVVPAESYFVLGDNSANSMDSRFWGAVSFSNVLGRVKVR